MAVDRQRPVSARHVLGDFLVDETFPAMAEELEPSDAVVANLERLAALLDRMAEQHQTAWRVRSGYRDERLNDACREAGLPASVDSLHLFGCAADIEPVDDVDLEAVFDWLQAEAGPDFPVHEAVYYPMKGFIHVAVECPDKPTPKRMLMRT